ncbi:hypothetical protein [Roseibacillus ishigakijimensis]|uniref:Uncharacterized protein n=1 Tax=Roseibacillus ishigakijimensis TaxID=454146 RepID=A0A934RQW4_9BACT|nr:hypothetical protein [Roseibacillus ishigakijimensis]MBK1834237.1 hypothetical protein [Roseibacillus ishigakijimensis]
MDSELKQLEEELRGFAPSAVSGEVLSRMVEAMERWEEGEVSAVPVADTSKIVAFPQETRNLAGWRPMWAAAAAVAILGASVGLLMPRSQESGVTAMTDLGPVPLLRQASLVPVNVQRKVSSLEAGVVENREGMQYQLIRVVRQEEADFRAPEGAGCGLKVSQPKVDYYMVPVSY